MATVDAVILQALEKLGVKGAEQTTTTTDEQSLGLKNLNDILELWSLDDLAVYDLVTVTHTLVAGTASYTIGASATIDTGRPIEIVTAYVTSDGNDYPIDIRTPEEYDAISDKARRGMPDRIAYDPEYPQGRLLLWPTPDAGYTLTLRVRRLITSFANKDAEVSLPPGYKPALVAALALALAPSYNIDEGRQSRIGAEFERAYGLIKQANRRVPRTVSEVFGLTDPGDGYDIRSDV